MFWGRKCPLIDPLDRQLLQWSPHDPFTVRNLLDGGVCIMGRVGSGKTSSSGRLLGEAIVGMANSSGLICVPKSEDVAMWRQTFAKAGRPNDLLEFDADGSPLRLNFLQEAQRHGGHTREITRCIMTIGETLRSNDQRGNGEDSAFWAREQERMIYNAVEVLKAAGRSVSALDLQAFITSAAFSPTQLSEPAWQSGFHCRAMEAAYMAAKSPMEAHDFELAVDYWLGEIPNMADRTRSSIMTSVLGLLHVFNTGIVRELVSTTTNVSPDDMLERRKWVLVNVPPARFGDLGTFINAGWKYLTQRRVLRREAVSGDPIHVCWCDEANQFVNQFDGCYSLQARSHLGCLVFLTQSLHSMYSAHNGEGGRHQVDSLLSNFGQRIFHVCGDIQTAEWASALAGKRLETFMGGSMQPARDVYDELMGHQHFSGSFSTHYEPALQASVFMQGLRTGGVRNGYLADAILIKSGEPFSSGENFLRVTLSQR
jgi:hypothetical protein